MYTYIDDYESDTAYKSIVEQEKEDASQKPLLVTSKNAYVTKFQTCIYTKA